MLRIAPFIACTYLLLVILGACGPVPSHHTFHVRRLLSHETIQVGDQSLSDWPAGSLVWEISVPEATSTHQWTTVRDRRPEPPTPGDLNLQVSMAHDGNQWYVAIYARDDTVVVAKDPKRQPYGGDSFELFFAGRRLDERADIHHLIGSSTRQLFQVIVSPASNSDRESVLSVYRTDTALREHMLRPGSGFSVSVWRISQGEWAAELRLPIEVFSDDVRQRIRDGLKMRIGFDYLDYDGEPARHRDIAPEYGFQPDNVFSHDTDEGNVNVPGLMPSIVFDGA